MRLLMRKAPATKNLVRMSHGWLIKLTKANNHLNKPRVDVIRQILKSREYKIGENIILRPQKQIVKYKSVTQIKSEVNLSHCEID